MGTPNQWRVKRLAEKIAKHYGITIDELIGQSQFTYVAWPRMVTYYLASKRTNASASEIGRALGMRACCTVLNGTKRVKARLAKEPIIRAQIEEVERVLS